jgi:hypothetical protein
MRILAPGRERSCRTSLRSPIHHTPWALLTCVSLATIADTRRLNPILGQQPTLARKLGRFK